MTHHPDEHYDLLSLANGELRNARAEIERLTAERAAISKALQTMEQQYQLKIDEVIAALNERDALRAALNEYGWHYEGCPQYPTYTRPELWPACTCGFDAARSKT